jgi:hypothetical protein
LKIIGQSAIFNSWWLRGKAGILSGGSCHQRNPNQEKANNTIWKVVNYGELAQLGARRVRNAEVRGSIPLFSTNVKKYPRSKVGLEGTFLHLMKVKGREPLTKRVSGDGIS